MNEKIEKLSQMLFERQNFDCKTSQQNQYTLLLGAGASIDSGGPSCQQLCKEYCEEHSISVTDNDNSEASQRDKYITAFQNAKKDRIGTYLAFAKKLSDKEPSTGYYHLATLIKKNVFKTIITTNYDNLLEKALTKIMPIEEIKVLIRGEVTDEYIAKFIKEGVPKVKIIKLHGDLQSNIFFYKDEQSIISTDLQNFLKDCVKNGSIIVGHEMLDADLKGIYTGTPVYNFFVNPIAPDLQVKKILNLNDPEQIINDKIMRKAFENGKEVEKEDCIGYFDTFFTELNLRFQKNIIKQEEQKQKRNDIEEKILEESQKGVGYINYNDLRIMVDEFWNTIRKAYKDELPDVIVFINDPSAGGMELKRLMSHWIESYKEKKLS